ncbi:MAG TPA: prolyl oligopeptidase family serine peptidase [Gemmatimonadaceae bacterium]|nr:prolyl oligopeptidase family serine peptidase [Gemmatimonadaceae bacterium]
MRRLLCICLVLGTPAQAQSPTLDALLSVPFPTALTSSPTGALAWAVDSAGVRNVWVAIPPAYIPRRLTAYQADDGQTLSALQWLPGDSAVVYVRGGDPNAQGELPNPAFLADGVTQTVWIASLHDAPPRRLGDGGNAAVAPTGRVAFLQKGQIWWAPSDGHAAAEQLLHTRGHASALRWSPDGARLAFVSTRGDHAFVGVYDVTTNTLRYLAPSVDSDEDPAWSPDSRHVAFVRLPVRTRVTVFGARRTGRPWSIWIADASTGAGHAVWTADTGVGSVFHALDDPEEIEPPNLFWARGDQLIFPWEQDGWLHLYRVPATGGPATLLTPGAFEVGQATLTPDRGAILASSNAHDIDRRHCWRIPVDTPPIRLTSGAGIEWGPVAITPDGSTVALLRSDATSPARPSLVTDRAPPRDLTTVPSWPMISPEAVTFPAADGMLVHAQLFVPPGAGRHPAIVFFHGGSERQMLLGFHYMQYYSNAYALNQYFAAHGYVVLSVNYRSGIGYGMPYREALHYGATGASEYNDIVGAARYLHRRADVDSSHIGAWGGSYGGYLTALALARASTLFAAGVDFHGVHDWNLEFDALVPGWNIARDQAARRLAYASSPMADVARWRSPVLLIQGDDDRDVNFSQTVQLTEDLRAHGVHVETIVFPDEVHAFLRHADWLTAYRATVDFFGRTLHGLSTGH